MELPLAESSLWQQIVLTIGLLVFCRQQPPYLVQGVSSNETVYQDVLLAHETYNINGPLETTVEASVWQGSRL